MANGLTNLQHEVLRLLVEGLMQAQLIGRLPGLDTADDVIDVVRQLRNLG